MTHQRSTPPSASTRLDLRLRRAALRALSSAAPLALAATCLVVGPLLAEPQRGSQPGRPSQPQSRPQSQPSRPQSQPSRPQSQPSRPQSQPSRPQAQPSRPQAQPSRPQAQPSRPQAQPAPQPSRPAPSQPARYEPPTRYQPSGGAAPTPSVRPTTSPAPTNYGSAPSRPSANEPGPTAPSAGRTQPAGAPTRGWTPAAQPPSGRGNVIDLGEGSVRPQRQAPAFDTAGRSVPARTSPGDGPPLQVRARQTSDAERALEDARRAQAARSSTVVRDRAVTREDILDRYRGATRSATVTTPTRGPSSDSDAARIAAARQDAAQRAGSSTDARGPGGRVSAARADAARDATRDATPKDDSRADAARGATGSRSDATRGGATRSDAADRGDSAQPPGDRSLSKPARPTGSDADRVRAGRKDYLDAIAAKGDRGQGPGGRPAVNANADGGGRPAVTAGAYGGGRPAVSAGTYGGGHGHGGYGHYQSGHTYNGYCHNGWSLHYGHSFWNTWGWSLGCSYGSWWWSPFYTCGYWWNSYWYSGGYWNQGYRPSCYWYGPFLPWTVSVYVESEPEIVYVEQEPEVIYVAAAGEATVPANVPAAAAPANDGQLNRAADYYLSLGDRAFLEGRYGDAVHHYAKAVEFSPEDGILHLVLADALFATGDYRYAAYALREALDRDPALAANVVDKRSFYADPTEFDRQLAILERYLEDHFLDDDARLVLAANYLFGGRPIDAMKLLESPFSEVLRTSTAGALLLDAARQAKQRGLSR